MSEIEVRAAEMADEKAVLELAGAEMEAHARMDERFRLRRDASSHYAVYLRDRMRDSGSSVFVAAEGGHALGLAIGTVRKQNSFFEAQRFGYVSDLIVAPSARRRGIGRALFDRTALWFRSHGIDVVRLHVAVRSDEARGFWRSLGAREFLVEAWIDLEESAAPEASSDEPPTADAAPTPEAPAAPPAPRSGFDYPDDVLTGPEGGRP